MVGSLKLIQKIRNELLYLLITSDESCFCWNIRLFTRNILGLVKNSVQDYIVNVINISIRHPNFNIIKQYVDFIIKYSRHVIFLSKEFNNLDQEVLKPSLQTEGTMLWLKKHNCGISY